MQIISEFQLSKKFNKNRRYIAKLRRDGIITPVAVNSPNGESRGYFYDVEQLKHLEKLLGGVEN